MLLGLMMKEKLGTFFELVIFIIMNGFVFVLCPYLLNLSCRFICLSEDLFDIRDVLVHENFPSCMVNGTRNSWFTIASLF